MVKPWVLLKNGKVTSDMVAQVDVTAPMWTEGRSLFETLLVRPAGEFGLYREGDHARRLAQAAQRLGWEGAPSVDTLVGWMRQAARLFKGRGSGLGRMRVTTAWTSRVQEPVTYVMVVPYVKVETPLHLLTSNIPLPRLGKMITPKSGNRLAYALAESMASGHGADEALLVDEVGVPLEGAKSTLFVVWENNVLTPPLNEGVLPGITRQRLLELSDRIPLTLREEAPRPEWFTHATGYFMTNALWGVRPVGQLDGRRVNPTLPEIMKCKKAFEEDVARYLQTGNQETKLL